MGITVKHEPDFRFTGRVAYETGLGEQSARKEQMARQEAQQAAQRALAREQMARSSAAQDKQIAAQMEMDKLNHSQQLEILNQQNANVLGNHAAFADIDSQKAIELDKSKYTLQQQRQIEDVAEKTAWIDQQPWKPEEKDAAKKQLQWQYATGQSKSPWTQESPQDLVKKSTFIDENGRTVHVSPTGEIKYLDEAAFKAHGSFIQKTVADMLKIPKSLEDSSPMYTPQECFQVAQKLGSMQYPQFYPEIAKRQRTVRSVMEEPDKFLQSMSANLMDYDQFGSPTVNGEVAANIKAMQTLISLGAEDKVAIALEKMGVIRPLPTFAAKN